MAAATRRPRPRRSNSKEADKLGQVQSLARALRIMEALASTHDGLKLTEVSQTVGLAPSTAHRLLTTLQQSRFVRFDPLVALWQVGVTAFSVGNAFARHRDVVTMSRPFMRQLMELSGETANLYIMNDDEAICMMQIECRQMMRAIARPGGRVKMHNSGVGKAILAWLPGHDLARVLEHQGLKAATEKTLTTPRALHEDLKRIRRRGFAIDDEEHAVGLRCVAAPIFDEHSSPLAALSISGPAARVSDQKLGEFGAMVVEAARAVTAELSGCAGPRKPTPWRQRSSMTVSRLRSRRHSRKTSQARN